MQIDKEWMSRWFSVFNSRYFGGSLPEPKLKTGRSRTRLGTFSVKGQRTWRGVRLTGFTITVSNYYDQSERGFQNVLLHEMIHYSIAYSGLHDTSPHGVIFRGIMSRLNRDGWNISVATSARGLKKAYTGDDSRAMHTYLVLAIVMTDGRLFLSSVNPKYARRVDHDVSHASGGIKAFRWYTTDDRYFEDFPLCRSLRARRVKPEVFARKTAAMRPFSLP